MRRSPMCKCNHHYNQHHYVDEGDTDPCDVCDCMRFESMGRIE